MKVATMFSPINSSLVLSLAAGIPILYLRLIIVGRSTGGDTADQLAGIGREESVVIRRVREGEGSEDRSARIRKRLKVSRRLMRATQSSCRCLESTKSWLLKFEK